MMTVRDTSLSLHPRGNMLVVMHDLATGDLPRNIKTEEIESVAQCIVKYVFGFL